MRIKIRIIIFSALVLFFCLMTMLVINGGIEAFEYNVYTVFARYINPTLTSIMTVITNMGSAVAIITIIIALLIFPFTRIEIGIPVTVNAVLTSVLNIVLKIVIARDRPDILRLVAVTGYGFPSGHSMNNAALYAIIILIVFSRTKNKKIRLPVLLFGMTAAFLIGISRIYLGVHNTGDVLAGWAMGVAVALLVDTAYTIFLLKRKVVK